MEEVGRHKEEGVRWGGEETKEVGGTGEETKEGGGTGVG